jgi:hypothetical protein
MFAENATQGNEYMLHLRTHYLPGPVKATCSGWNHDHSKVLFFFMSNDLRIVMALYPKDVIKTVE